jgi:hypothetical protein
MKKRDCFIIMPNKLCRSRVSPRAQKVFACIASYNPSFPPYSEIERRTGMTDKTIAKGIAELLGRRMLGYQQGNFRERVANEYSVLPDEGWLLDLSEEDSLSIGKRMMASQREAGLAFQKEAISLSNGEYKKNKKKTNSLGEEAKVVSLATKGGTADVPCISSGNGVESSTHFDLAINDPTTQHETRTFLKQMREALKSKEFISRPPSLVEEFVTKCGPSAMPLDCILDQIIRPELFGSRKDEFFVKLQSSVTRAFEAGQVAHQLANETPQEQEARIRLATQRKLQRRAMEGAIDSGPANHRDDPQDKEGGSP